MYKNIYPILIILLASILGACSDQQNVQEASKNKTSAASLSEPSVKKEQDVEKTSKPKGSDVTSSKGNDVVDKDSNTERIEQFISNFTKNKEDKLRIIKYTVEGDPIFYDLQFDGKSIHFTQDRSQDAYGSLGIEKDVCTQVTAEKVHKESANFVQNGTAYYIEGCSKNPQESVPLLFVVE